MIKAVLVLLLAAFVVGQGPFDDTTCQSRGMLYPGGCACISGSLDATCAPYEGTCSFPAVLPLETAPVAELMGSKSSIASNTLSLVIESPATANRYFSTVQLGTNVSCSYPGPHFTKTFSEADGCVDSFTGTFSIPDVGTCGFVQDSTVPGTLSLNGGITVEAVDYISEFRGYSVSRTTKSVLELVLNLPTFVNVTSNVTYIVSPIDPLVAITRQEYVTATDDLILEYTSSVQWPYRLYSPSVSGEFPGLTTTTEIVNITCSDNAECLQLTTLTLKGLATGACALSLFSFSSEWSYDCRADPALCPVVSSPFVSVTSTISTEDVCGSVSIDASISGTVDSFSDATFLNDQIAFVAGDRVYLAATITADVSIEALFLKDLTVVSSKTTTIISNFEVVVGSASPIADENAVTESNRLGFSFLATYGTAVDDLFDSSTEAVQTFTVEATIDVTYVTSFGGVKKRDTIFTSFELSKKLVLDASQA